jgi:hypothetical protein
MHPTRNSAALKLNLLGGRVMPGVRCFEALMILMLEIAEVASKIAVR